MPKVIKVSEISSIHVLRENGWSIRQISRSLGLDRRTVRKYLDVKCTTNPNAGSLKIELPEHCRRGPSSSCESFRSEIVDQLKLGLSGVRIHQDLVERHAYEGSIQSVRRFIRTLSQTTPLPFRVLHRPPGEEVQVDFGLGAPITQDTGKRKRPHLFRLVLSHSRHAYSEVVWRQDTESFIRALENAFRSFGGVTNSIVTDNLKAAVIKADWYDPEINPKLRSFAHHYGTVVLPTKPYRPEHKGKVESSVKYCQNNALKGRNFASLAAQNAFLKDWETNVADTRIHGTTQIQVRAAFKLEKPHFKPLPPTLFPCFSEGQRKVQRNGHVEITKAFYSAPPEYLGRTVWARYDQRTVRIYDQKWQQIAIHSHVGRGQYSTLKTHIPKEKISLGEFGSGYLIEKALAIGPECAIWAEIMLENRGIEGIRVLQGLISLKKNYTPGQLNQAALNAINHEAFYLKEFKELIGKEQQQPTMKFLECHPLIRKMSSYAQLTPKIFDQPSK